ncbi:right-handed parallel beta-helix repeat-containing protein [Candidatus Parcubacteria bacterium]|nr:right-handed parallel beta-helix repeat-containing protein [Candidatus Parcubacteria bacterium]
MNKSFTLVEVLVGIALMLIIFIGIFGAYQLSLKVIMQSKARVTAVAIGNQQIEQVRNIPYEDVGVISGYPDGKIKGVATTTRGNVEYTITARVDYIDDPRDGLGVSDNAPGCPEDYQHCVNDYKKVNFKVSWVGHFGGEIFFNSIVAPGDCYQECGEKGGIIKVSAAHENGNPVEFVYIEVDNINASSSYFGLHKDSTPADGDSYFVLPPEIDSYRIKVSKTGYSSDQTYGKDEVYQGKVIANPTKPHASVLEGQIWPVSFKIDKLSKFSIKVLEAKAGNVYYVRKSGDNDNDGLSPDAAFFTIQKAAETLIAGDMLFVGAGDYNEEVSPQSSGTSAAQIVYIADTTGVYTGDAGVVKIIAESNGFYIENEKYIKIYGFKITNATSSGVFIKGASTGNIELINNTIYSNLGDGIYVESASDVVLSHNVLYSNLNGIFLNSSDSSSLIKNTLYQNGFDGIKLKGSGNVVLEFNEVFSNGERGIFVYSNNNHCQIKNNIVYLNAGDGIKVFDHASSMNFYNNKSYSNQGSGIVFEKSISNANNISSNLVYANQKSGIALSDSCVNNTILNNTFFQNSENGILIELGSNNNEIKNNIVINNVLAGIKVSDSPNIDNSYNNVWQNNPNYDGISAATTSICLDPLIIDSDGPDDVWGGSNGIDDSFELSQISAGQLQDSPCLNTGSDTASNLGMDNKTTRTDNIGDSGIVDTGFHYSLEFSPVFPSSPDPFGVEISNTEFHLLLEEQAGVPAIVGTDSFLNNIYKYSEDHETDVNGFLEIDDAEFGSYIFSDFKSFGQDLDLMISWPSPMSIYLAPDVVQEVKLGLKAKNTLLATVQDAGDSKPLFSAEVRVFKVGYDSKKVTNADGQAYFIPLEKDWYNLEVSADGYATSTTSVFTNGHAEKTVNLNKL